MPSPTGATVDAALDVQEALVEAQSQRDAARLASLRAADAALSRLRLYLRLATTGAGSAPASSST